MSIKSTRTGLGSSSFTVIKSKESNHLYYHSPSQSINRNEVYLIDSEETVCSNRLFHNRRTTGNFT